MDKDDIDNEPIAWTKLKSCVPVRLCVLPEFQRKGVGKQVMEFLIEYTKNEGYRAFQIIASITNKAANQLYQRLGYRKMGEVELNEKIFNAYDSSHHYFGKY